MSTDIRILVADLEACVNELDAAWPCASETGVVAHTIATGRALVAALAAEDEETVVRS